MIRRTVSQVAYAVDVESESHQTAAAHTISATLNQKKLLPGMGQ